jgi:hypothetical protein
MGCAFWQPGKIKIVNAAGVRNRVPDLHILMSCIFKNGFWLGVIRIQRFIFLIKKLESPKIYFPAIGESPP